MLGIGLVAVPTGIISAGFMEQMNMRKREDTYFCPYCGKKL
jgi:voltage-gated potassium channel